MGKEQKNERDEKHDEKMKFVNKDFLPKIKRNDAEEPSRIQPNELFQKRWRVDGVIGKGGYGEIYLAMDLVRGEEVAIKVEPKERKGKLAKRMILEELVMSKMQGKSHVPLMFGSGFTDKFNFIIMQLLSTNIGDIKKGIPEKRLSQCSVGRIIHQAIDALRDLHDTGYVHRDVKPTNMCFGVYPHTRHQLILLDFGLVRRFKKDNGEWREHRRRVGFRGTTRYVSVRVHRRMEQAPVDDMVSLMYTAYELLVGELPWKTLEKLEEIQALKEVMVTENGLDKEMFKGTALLLVDFVKLVTQADPMKCPPYDILVECIKKLYEPKKMVDPYDWEEEPSNQIDDFSEDHTQSTRD